MQDTIETEELVATVVEEDKRLDFLPKLFGPGRAMLEGEGVAYHFMREFCSEYDGGYWEYYTTNNGAFFMVPTSDTWFEFESMNGSRKKMSPMATGIAITIFAITYVMERFQKEKAIYDQLYERYFALRDFVSSHDEAASIWAVID